MDKRYIIYLILAIILLLWSIVMIKWPQKMPRFSLGEKMTDKKLKHIKIGGILVIIISVIILADLFMVFFFPDIFYSFMEWILGIN